MEEREPYFPKINQNKVNHVSNTAHFLFKDHQLTQREKASFLSKFKNIDQAFLPKTVFYLVSNDNKAIALFYLMRDKSVNAKTSKANQIFGVTSDSNDSIYFPLGMPKILQLLYDLIEHGFRDPQFCVQHNLDVNMLLIDSEVNILMAHILLRPILVIYTILIQRKNKDKFTRLLINTSTTKGRILSLV